MHKWLLCTICFLVLNALQISAQVTADKPDQLAKQIKQHIRDKRFTLADSLIQELPTKAGLHSTSYYSNIQNLLKAELNRAKGNFTEARNILNKTQIRLAKDKAITAEYYYIKSKLAGNPRSAKNLITKGIEAKQEIPVTGLTDLSHFYNSLGVYYQQMYGIDSAKHYYKLAIKTAQEREQKPEYHKDIALFYQNLALPYAMRQDYQIARKHLFKSVNILNQLETKRSDDLARNYLNIGRIYLLTGSLDSATYYYNRVLKIRESSSQKMPSKLAIVYNNLGELQTSKNNMAKARIYFQKAQQLYEKANTNTDQQLHQLNLNLGYTYSNQEEYEQAVNYFKKAIQSTDEITLGKAYRNLADCYVETNKPDSANYYFKKAINRFKQSKSRGRYDLALTYLYYGNFLLEPQKPDALEYLNKGKDILVKIFGEFHRDVARANSFIAKYYLKNKDYQKALAYAQEAITSSINDFDNTNPEANPETEKFGNKSHLITPVSLKGKIYFQRGKENNSNEDLEKSLKAFETAIEIINRIRINYTYESNKLMITERSQEEFNWILKVLRELHKRSEDNRYLSQIFEYMEKSKAAVLLSSITDSKAKITANLPDSIIEKEKWLRTRINGFKNLVYQERQKKVNNRNEKKIEDWESIIFESQQQYDSLKNYIKNQYNQYYKLRMKPSVMKLEEVVSRMGEDEVILEYSILEDQVMIMTVKKDKQAFHVVELSENNLNKLINTFRNNLRVKAFANFDRKSYHQFTQAGYNLYKNLVEPVQEHTKGKDLVIIPDGKMGYIPFELFMTKSKDQFESNNMNYKKLPYLLKKRTISYAYSSTLLFSEIEEKKPKKKKVLAMAPSYENISDKPIDSIFRHRQSGEILLPIPGVGKEVNNISKTFKSRIFKDTLATEQAFKQVAPDYSVLHLAMHAIVDDTDPMYSKLVFYQDPKNTNQGLLNTYELFDLSLGAEMAVLSACNTGYGKLQRGEGIMSLARGFLYAGVPNIVMTLWPIEDESTSEIMNYFYQHLSQGAEKDEALRKAKLQFLKNTDMLNAHPHFWGSFVSIGPDTPLRNVKEQSTTPYWIGGGLVLAVIIGLIFRRRIK